MVAAIYLALGIAWIVCSDAVMAMLVPNFERFRWLGTAKGVFYVFMTAFIGYVLARTMLRRRDELAERERESRRRLTTLLANLPGMAYRCRNDDQWTMEFVSEGAKALTGHTPEALVGSKVISWLEVIHPEDRELVRRAVWAGLAVHRAFEISYRIQTASGEIRYVWEQGRGVFGHNGVLVALEGYIADITAERIAEAERAQLAERVRRAEQLEQLGMFAGGITHDFNNLLVGVLGNIELAIADLPEDAPARAACERVRASAQSAAGLTHQLLAFTGRGRIDVQAVSLSELAHETAGLLGVLRFPGVRFREEIAEGLLPVTGDPSQLRQVVMNLLLNARDALGEGGGRITLRTGAALSGGGHGAPPPLAAFALPARVAGSCPSHAAVGRARPLDFDCDPDPDRSRSRWARDHRTGRPGPVVPAPEPAPVPDPF
jgi:PAS domain S-box-containing protein